MAITLDVGIIGRWNFGIVISNMDTFDILNKQKNSFCMGEGKHFNMNKIVSLDNYIFTIIYRGITQLPITFLIQST